MFENPSLGLLHRVALYPKIHCFTILFGFIPHFQANPCLSCWLLSPITRMWYYGCLEWPGYKTVSYVHLASKPKKNGLTQTLGSPMVKVLFQRTEHIGFPNMSFKHLHYVYMAVDLNSFICKRPFFANKQLTFANLWRTLRVSFVEVSC